MILNRPRSLGFGNSHVSAKVEVSVSDLGDIPGDSLGDLSLFDDPDDNPDDSDD